MNKNNGPIGELEEEVLSTIKHWWVILIVGLLAIGVGIWMLFRPGLAYEALASSLPYPSSSAGLAPAILPLLTERTPQPGDGTWSVDSLSWSLALSW